MKALTATLFILMCAAQWYVPVSEIVVQEEIIRHGRIFRFKTEPLDPTDPFRGKYVTLRFQQEVIRINGEGWSSGQKAYAIVEEDRDGFAVVTDIVDTPPVDLDFIPVTIADAGSGRVRVRFPFDRLYLEESKAPEAERLYWDNVSDSTQQVYAVVRIKDGKTNLQYLMINGHSIVDIVRETNVSDE